MNRPLRVLYEHFDRIDRGDALAAAELFTLDARAEIMTGKVIEGRERIGRALQRVLAAYARTSHHVSNPLEERRGHSVVLRRYVYAHHRLRMTGATWHATLAPLGAALRHVRAHRRQVAHLRARPCRRRRAPGAERDPEAWYPGHPGRPREPRPLPDRAAEQAVAAASPAAASALENFRGAATAPAVLEPAEAALVAACAAATRREERLLRAALERALANGRTGARQRDGSGGGLGNTGGTAPLPR